MNDDILDSLKDELLEVVERALNTEEKKRNIDVVNELLRIVENIYDI